MKITDAIAKAHTPAQCEEAESYRAALGAMTDYAAKMLEDRYRNLEWAVVRIGFTDHREKEDMRNTIRALKDEYVEFFKGERTTGWCR